MFTRSLRRYLGAAVVAAGVGALVGLASCDGSSSTSEVAPPAEHPLGADFPVQLVALAWPMAVHDELALEPFANKQGWVDLVSRRNLAEATKGLESEGGLAVARVHADAASLFRQAALTSANALVQTYGETPQDTDPVGVAHLLTVSYALAGDKDKAKEQAAKLVGHEDGPCAVWHAPWKVWLDSEAPWPPDLSTLPLGLPEPAPGTWPTIETTLPHYQLPEQGDSGTEVAMGDPGALVALALWHDTVARTAAGDSADVVDVYGARYRLPVEPAVDARVALPMEFLFGSDFAVPEDGAFVAALMGPEGVAAVDAHKDKSLLAALASAARVDGKLDPQKSLDLIASLRSTYVDDLEAKAGSAHAFHRTFAEVQTVGALRVLSLVAEAEGDQKASGILRINAMEKSIDEAACPVGLLSLAAWDAGNRYPMRGSDIIHSQSRRYPSLETARFALDVLSIRVGRERGTGGVGM